MKVQTLLRLLKHVEVCNTYTVHAKTNYWPNKFCDLDQIVLPESLNEKVLQSQPNENGHQGIENRSQKPDKDVTSNMCKDTKTYFQNCEMCNLKNTANKVTVYTRMENLSLRTYEMFCDRL